MADISTWDTARAASVAALAAHSSTVFESKAEAKRNVTTLVKDVAKLLQYFAIIAANLHPSSVVKAYHAGELLRTC
jgi:hypothetical protein